MRLDGKTAIVTGGSRGIGRAICIELAKEGAAVLVNYYANADKGYEHGASEVVDQIRSSGGDAMAFDADVADKEVVLSMVSSCMDNFGSLDILVANAGICPFKPFLDIDEQLLDLVIGVNFKGAFFAAQAAVDKMVELGTSGRIIFTSSVSSIFGGELQAHYCATKGAVNQMMKSIAIAAGKNGITANAVLPGTVVTDINRKQLEEENPELKQYFIDRTPIGRLPSPKDIAKAVVFFASEDARCISGATLVVDGGMSVNLQ